MDYGTGIPFARHASRACSPSLGTQYFMASIHPPRRRMALLRSAPYLRPDSGGDEVDTRTVRNRHTDSYGCCRSVLRHRGWLDHLRSNLDGWKALRTDVLSLSRNLAWSSLPRTHTDRPIWRAIRDAHAATIHRDTIHDTRRHICSGIRDAHPVGDRQRRTFRFPTS